MKNIYHKLTAAGSVVLLAPFTAFAAGTSTGGGLGGATSSLQNVGAGINKSGGTVTSDLPTLIGTLINTLLGVLGIIFVVLTVYAGFLWMTAQGSEENVKKAKGMLTQAIIGLVIIVAAYAISTFVINAITTAAGG